MSVSGVEVWSANGVYFAAFAASRLGVWADQPSGDRVIPHGPSEALSLSGAAVVLDGPMFGECSSGDSYATSGCSIVRFSQYDRSSGVVLSGTDSGSEGITIAVVDGSASAIDGWQVPDGASVAVQCYPTLVRGGADVAGNGAGTNGNAEWRAGVGILGDGRVFFAAGSRDMRGFAGVLINAGATDAGYTDGGGSAALWLSDGQQYGASEQRRVATWLIARQTSILESLVPTTTAGKVMVVGAVAAVAAVGYELWEAYAPKRGR